jgi:hypothetical protein
MNGRTGIVLASLEHLGTQPYYRIEILKTLVVYQDIGALSDKEKMGKHDARVKISVDVKIELIIVTQR